MQGPALFPCVSFGVSIPTKCLVGPVELNCHSISRKQVLPLEGWGGSKQESDLLGRGVFLSKALHPFPGSCQVPALSPGIRRTLGTASKAKECPTHSIWSHFLPGRRRKEKEEIQPPPAGRGWGAGLQVGGPPGKGAARAQSGGPLPSSSSPPSSPLLSEPQTFVLHPLPLSFPPIPRLSRLCLHGHQSPGPHCRKTMQDSELPPLILPFQAFLAGCQHLPTPSRLRPPPLILSFPTSRLQALGFPPPTMTFPPCSLHFTQVQVLPLLQGPPRLHCLTPRSEYVMPFPGLPLFSHTHTHTHTHTPANYSLPWIEILLLPS